MFLTGLKPIIRKPKMPKRLEVTPRIQTFLDSAAGESFDSTKVAVFETISLNSLPVSKNNIFQGAVHPRQTLLEMAAAVSSRPLKGHVPMHTNHEQGLQMPVGKVFHADVITNTEGTEELRSLFYIDNSEPQLIAKVESNSIEEVSVGVRYKHLNCSQCGFDFLGSEATDMNIWDRVCNNDHQIGTEGVHLICNGLDRWLEQSLVSLGAAQGAKIQAHTRALLGEDVYTQLAATGRDPAATTLYATATTPQTENTEMDLKELVLQLTAAEVQKAALEMKLTAATVELELLRPQAAKLVDLQKEVETLKATDVLKISQENTAALTFIRTEAKRLVVANGGEEKSIEAADLTALTASIEANRKGLADKFPTGGRSLSASTSDSDKTSGSFSTSFKTR